MGPLKNGYLLSDNSRESAKILELSSSFQIHLWSKSKISNQLTSKKRRCLSQQRDRTFHCPLNLRLYSVSTDTSARLNHLDKQNLTHIFLSQTPPLDLCIS